LRRYVRAGRKPGSVSPGSHRVNRGTMTIPLVPMSPSGSGDLPGNSGGPPSGVPLFGLAPGGVFLAPAVTGRTGELLPHRFTLTPAERPPGRFPFCGTFLPVARTGSYPAPCPAEPGLSSPLPAGRAAVICPALTYPFIITHLGSFGNPGHRPSR
jgi:hypothetical protein